MNLTIDQLESAALTLPVDERKRLAEKLLNSLSEHPEVTEDNILVAWVAEAQRRLAEIHKGQVQPLDVDQLFQNVRSRLDEG